MSSYIEKSKNTIKRILKTVKKSEKGEIRDLRFGFVAYRDHPPQDDTYVTKTQDLADEETIIKFISSLSAKGGGDGPEAVMDGLYDSIYKMSWNKDSLKYIFHIADAPPHGR